MSIIITSNEMVLTPEQLEIYNNWKSVGYSKEMCEKITELSKIGGDMADIDCDSATKSLIEVMKQYELDNDSTIKIIDKLNKL